MTKKGRTIMTAFAGSIGIIGIAAILSLANGVNNYIASVEEETLSSYPLQITSTGFDMTSMMVSTMGMGATTDDGTEDGAAADSGDDTVVNEAAIMGRMFDSVGSNDLASLKEFLESGDSGIDQYVNDIEYKYNVVANVFLADTSDGVTQVNPDTTFASMGIGSGMSSSGIMSQMMSTDMFAQMMGTVDMAKEGYDVKAGHWPEKPNECVLVLTHNGSVSDFLLYILGLRDRAVMDEMVRAFVNEEEFTTEIDDDEKFTYRDFLDLKLKLVCSADFYQYDEEFGVWVDKSGDEEYMKGVIANSEDLVISGIIQPKDDGNSTMMSSGIYYTPALTDHLIEMAGQTQIVKDQLAEPSVDVFNGKTFAEEAEDGNSEDDFGMENLFTIDTDALSAAFKFDENKMKLDLSGLDINFDSSSLPAPPPFDPSALGGGSGEGSGSGGTGGTDASTQATAQMISAMLGDYMRLLGEGALNPTPDPTKPGSIQASIQDYLTQPSAQAIMKQYADTMAAAQEQQMAAMQAYIQQYMQEYMTQTMTALSSQMQQAITAALTKAMGGLATSMSSAMSIDEEAFKNAFSFDMSEEELTELIMSMMTPEEASFDNNLAKLDYAQMEKPYEIDIFAKDFEAKQGVIDILDAYNDEMNSTGQESKAITYTDIVGALMSSVTTIIDMISYVLIAFVSISLIVSSIMIGVITYISVLERKKEIGILRAIGASKRNISQIFNAETVIEGLISGVLGVGITALCCIPASAIVYALFDVPNVASLPWMAGLILIIISVFLSFIAGLIPASSASRKDPVEALRSE